MDALSAIKRYNLDPPSEQDLLASLNRLMKPEQSQQLWSTACKQINVRPPMSIDQFEKALLQLKDAKGMASIAANSILIRVKSYRSLSNTAPKAKEQS
ncbi:hypothetical protein [Pseudoduganella chitinolytica]|uniref:DUF3135 domain-containing protein n=1 Tax=Pseudoduganella chitinolytica TaxID=34070 RepID=A0ABY8BFD7_9BURK|nr:hypothetical protein [Pseudoduganella chitinolytica]WEF34636.1 hypothetical protein PX653_07705 [Pseudoduganella chitinolytica]